MTKELRACLHIKCPNFKCDDVAKVCKCGTDERVMTVRFADGPTIDLCPDCHKAEGIKHATQYRPC